MALARIPDPNQQLRASMPKVPSAGRAGVQTTPAVRSTVNRIQPTTAPKAANAAPPGRPPNMGGVQTMQPQGNRFEAMKKNLAGGNALQAAAAGQGGWQNPAAPGGATPGTLSSAQGGAGGTITPMQGAAGASGGAATTPATPAPPAPGGGAPAPSGGAGGAAPAGGGGTAESTSVKHSPASASGITQGELGSLRGGILGALGSGLEGLYNDRAFTDAIGGLKGDVEAGTAGQLAAADADAARRGLFRSGMAGARAAAIRRGGSSDFSRQANDMRKAMTEANMDTRLKSAGQATDFLRGEEEKRMRQQQMRQAGAAAARANAPIPLFNEQTGEMEYLDPRVLQFMNAF